jgi:hypothetical protein
MYDFLLPICKWLESTPWGIEVRSSLWLYPYVQLIHFSGLSLWVGTIVLVDLRFLGLVRAQQTAGEFATQLMPWTWTGLAIAVTGGFLLFSATASTYLANAAFEVKIPLVLTGICYHYFLQGRQRKWGRSLAIPTVAKLATFTELLLWLSVVSAAVEIPNH